MSIIDPAVALSIRQEAFCRHYATSGNAADAAGQAGCALPERHAGFDGAAHAMTAERLAAAVGERRRDSLDQLRRNGPFYQPGKAGFAPDHDKT